MLALRLTSAKLVRNLKINKKEQGEN